MNSNVPGWTPASQADAPIIVVAEPDVFLRSAIVDSLKRDRYNVLHAGTPKRALKLIRQSPTGVKLLICAYEFPAADGLEVCSECLAISPGTGILVMARTVIDRKRIEAQQWDALQKPFSATVLRKKVQFLLNRGGLPTLQA
jgi:DNA-binding response OmpR family regulator